MPLQQRSSSIENLAKATFLHQVEEKHKFHHSHAVLLISVGQPVHEGNKLRAVIELVNKNFKSCDIAVCDVLQRYSTKIIHGISEEQAYQKCLDEGKQWVARNQDSIQQLQIDHKILHWEEYLSRKDFQMHKEDILSAYNNNAEFKTAMHHSIDEYVARREKKIESLDKQMAIDSCFQYLAEESAIIMKMWQDLGYNYIIYPGEIPQALKEARAIFIGNVNKDLLKWVTVYIRSRPNKITNR